MKKINYIYDKTISRKKTPTIILKLKCLYYDLLL
nr:MAG TPA: hypothetical protein [Caudoviricetes sp.]